MKPKEGKVGEKVKRVHGEKRDGGYTLAEEGSRGGTRREEFDRVGGLSLGEQRMNEGRINERGSILPQATLRVRARLFG